MNYIDILLLGIVLFSAWASFQRGAIISSLALLSWVGSFIIAFVSYALMARFLKMVIPAIDAWAAPLSFFIVVIVSRHILDALFFKILKDVPERTHSSMLNKVLGIIPGIVSGMVWAALLSVFLLLIPFESPVSKETRKGVLAEELAAKAVWLQNKLSPVFSEALSKTMHATPEKEKYVKLPYTVKAPTPNSGLEAKMLVLVNKERTQRGLKPLKADLEMTIVARKHSVDMFKRGYFSHYTPEGLDPFERMQKEKVRFLTAGENLALAQTLQIAHTGLMNSPGHRANILNPSFGRLGIGVLDGGIYGLMITQNFRN